MGKLINLEGTSREIDALFIENGREIIPILRNEYAATTAKSNGAINVWHDDAGNIRCEAMRHYNTLEKKSFKRYSSAVRWVDAWLKKIA